MVSGRLGSKQATNHMQIQPKRQLLRSCSCLAGSSGHPCLLRQLLTDGLQPVFRSSADAGWQLVRGEIGMLRLPESVLQNMLRLCFSLDFGPRGIQKPRIRCSQGRHAGLHLRVLADRWTGMHSFFAHAHPKLPCHLLGVAAKMDS